MAVSLLDLKAKRTQAVAPRSLFGTVIEIKTDDDVRKAESLPVPKRRTKRDKLAAFMPAETGNIMNQEKEEVATRVHKVRFAEDSLKEASYLALHFDPNPDTIQSRIPKGALTYHPKTHYQPYRNDIKLHSRDIALADHFNKLGLDDNPDYNYERYRRPFTNSTFRLGGTVIAKGGGFKSRDNHQLTRESFPPMIKRVPRVTRANQRGKSRRDLIPANIRFIHGPELCAELLRDEEKLKNALESQKQGPTRLTMAKYPTVTPNMELESDALYQALGTALKQDIFNGIPHSHVKSLNTSSYTQGVHDRSVETHPPKFGIQRNNDSKWSEDMVIRQRMYKAWDEMVARKNNKEG